MICVNHSRVGDRVVRAGQQVLVLQHLRQRGRLDAGARDVDVLVTSDDLVVQVVGLQAELHVDLVRQRLAVGVGRRVPVGVAHERAAGADVGVAVPHVRTRGDRVAGVLLAGVLGRRDRCRRGQLRQVVELGERLLEVEDDRVVVGRLDRRGDVGVLRTLEGTLVALRPGQQVGEVARALLELGPVDVARDGVGDVLGGDRRAVLELQALLDRVGPGLAAVGGLAEVGGHVGHQLEALLAGSRLVHHQRAEVVAAEVPGVAVVGVTRVEAVTPGGAESHLEGAALLVRGVDHLESSALLSIFGVGAVIAAPGVLAGPAGAEPQRRGSDQRHGCSLTRHAHLVYLPSRPSWGAQARLVNR